MPVKSYKIVYLIYTYQTGYLFDRSLYGVSRYLFDLYQ